LEKRLERHPERMKPLGIFMALTGFLLVMFDDRFSTDL
jgi:hypothetical protein